MSKYRVYLEAVASVSVDVEADDVEAAIELAFYGTPSRAWNWPDLGDWYFPPWEDGKLRYEDYVEETPDAHE